MEKHFGGVILPENLQRVIEETAKEDLLAYFYLDELLSSEVLPIKPVPVGYVISETKDNQFQPFRQAALLLANRNIQTIAIPDPKSPVYNYGYPGPEYCLDILKSINVPQDKIVLVTPQSPLDNINTATELDMVADYLKKRPSINSFVIIAPHFHLLRSYLSALTAFKQHQMEKVRIYVSGVNLPIYETVVHSQGTQLASRSQIAFEEIVKCMKYKNLIPINEALELHRKHRR